MANRPIQTPLPADLPTNWSNGQTVAPSGASVGLGTQYGYNYLMQQVNAAQQGVNSINAAFDGLAEGSDLPTATEIVYSLTAAYSGTVHQLTGLNGQTGILSCLFTAAAAYSSGDTFTVDGTAYTVKMQDGKDPTAGFFTAGAVVPVIVDTTAKTVNFKTGGVDISSATASPSDVLAGKTFFSGLSDLIQTGTYTLSGAIKYANGSAYPKGTRDPYLSVTGLDFTPVAACAVFDDGYSINLVVGLKSPNGAFSHYYSLSDSLNSINTDGEFSVSSGGFILDIDINSSDSYDWYAIGF